MLELIKTSVHRHALLDRDIELAIFSDASPTSPNEIDAVTVTLH